MQPILPPVLPSSPPPDAPASDPQIALSYLYQSSYSVRELPSPPDLAPFAFLTATTQPALTTEIGLRFSVVVATTTSPRASLHFSLHHLRPLPPPPPLPDAASLPSAASSTAAPSSLPQVWMPCFIKAVSCRQTMEEPAKQPSRGQA